MARMWSIGPAVATVTRGPRPAAAAAAQAATRGPRVEPGAWTETGLPHPTGAIPATARKCWTPLDDPATDAAAPGHCPATPTAGSVDAPLGPCAWTATWVSHPDGALPATDR